MNESHEGFVITEEQVVQMLDAKGIEDPEAKELLSRYTDQCHAEAMAESGQDAASTNHATIKAEVKIAKLFFKTEKYKERAKEKLDETLEGAYHNDSAKDLVEEIVRLLA